MRTSLNVIALICVGGLLTGCGTFRQSAKLEIKPVGEPATANMSSEAQFNKAKQHIALGNNALAIEILRRIKRHEPANVRVLNAMAVAYDRIGRFDVSRQYYEQAAGLDPNADYVISNLAYSLALQGRTQEARQLYARAATSSDAEVRLVALHAALPAPTIATENPYRPKLRDSGKIVRASSLVQQLKFTTTEATRCTLPSAGHAVALLSVTDDRAVAGQYTARGGQIDGWEELITAALSVNLDSERTEEKPAPVRVIASIRDLRNFSIHSPAGGARLR